MSTGDEMFEAEDEFVDELKPGTSLMLGQYTIERFLAAGGFGITYLAKDSLDRRVVIKECFPGSFCRRQNHSVMPRSRAHQEELKSIVRLFSQEALTLSKAGHPNIVGVHQVFEENNTAYMALDFVDGRDLLEILNEDPGSLTSEQIEQYLMKMLDAIGHVHSKGLLHRDISPDNIIINTNDEPVLIDFGAARESKDEKASRLLSALRVVKDGYSPQEFYIAGSEQGPSCDLYSLAASFYHIITGDLPPDSQSRLTAFAAGDADPYVPLGKRSKRYSKSFASALDKAMSILPKDRMQSAEEWKEHIEHGATGAAAPRRAAAPRASDSKSSMMPLLLGGTAIAAAAGAGFFYMSTQPTDTFDATTEAPRTASVAPEVVPDVASVAPDVEQDATSVPTDIAQQSDIEEAPTETAAAAEEPEVETDSAASSIIAEVDEPDELNAPATDDVAVAPEAVEDQDVPRTTALLEQPRIPATRPLPRTFAVPPSVEETETPADVDTAEVAVEEDPPTAEIATASETAEETAEPVVAEVEPAPEEVPTIVEAEVEAPDVALASSAWSVRLPFVAASENTNEVGEVLLNAWSWLTPGTRIASVNGIAIDDINRIQDVLRQSTLLTDQSQLDIQIGVETGASGAIREFPLMLPLVQHTTLSNGIAFEAAVRDGAWQTFVTEIPEGAVTSLRAGDAVVEYLDTGAQIDDRTSLSDAFDADQCSEMSGCALLVSRDGQVLEATIDFAPVETDVTVAEVEPAPIETPIAEDTAVQSANANADIGTIGAASVMEVEVPFIPFTLTASEPGVVDTVAEGAPFWLTQGVRIVSVNGTPASDNVEILNLVRQAARTDGGETTVTIGTDARLSNAAIERRLTISSERQTALLNGLVFVTRIEDGTAVTRVVQAPDGSSFQLGDKVVAFMATGETLDGTTTLKSILDRELAAGQTNFSFAVERQGEMWVEGFNLAALTE